MLAPWAILGGLIAGAAWIVWSEGGPNSFAARARSEALLATMRLGFEIDEVWVDGLRRSDRAEVLQAVGAIRGEPILEFDPETARERLLDLPWIKDAVVAVAYPSQVHIGLTERMPVALWQRQGELSVIDAEGAVIKGVKADGFGGLPILVGEGANLAAVDLFRLVGEQPLIAGRMTAAVLVAERRWNIRIDDRINVRLPAETPGAALARLALLEQEHGLLEKDIVAIDLRLDDRLIVRLAPGADAASLQAKNGRES